MATQGSLTDYERKRIENIKRNEQLLASLNIKSKLADLSACVKRQREEARCYVVSLEKKVKPQTPSVIRRSPRVQKLKVVPNESSGELGLISMGDANTCYKSDEALVSKILSVCKESRLEDGDGDRTCRVRASIDLDSMELAPENVARVLPGWIMSVKFFPSANLRMVAVGNRLGNLGFWNVDSENEDGDGDDGIYMYQSHPSPISSILIHPFSLNKITTSCHGGFIGSLDIKKETFSFVYSSDDSVISMSQQPDDMNSLYLGGSCGVVRIWDERCARSSCSWKLHDSNINTIDFNSESTNMMATSSSDGSARIWDLRILGKSKPEHVTAITHERSVHSAYFSPSGRFLATTSYGDKIRVVSGVNYEDVSIIKQTNKTWLSVFKGAWGWDDSYFFVANTKKGLDVIGTKQKRVMTTLESPYMTSAVHRLDPHPFNPGMLAGVTKYGQVYIWSQ